MMGRMGVLTRARHMMHANTTLVDRVDLATPLSLSSQPTTGPRLLPPRSGLERSDFVPWPDADLVPRQRLVGFGVERTHYARHELFRV